jgi:hypothetical protein
MKQYFLLVLLYIVFLLNGIEIYNEFHNEYLMQIIIKNIDPYYDTEEQENIIKIQGKIKQFKI